LQINGTLTASNINILGSSLTNIINSNFDFKLSDIVSKLLNIITSTNNISEGSNLYYTSSLATSNFFINLNSINANYIQNGSSNKFIINGIYDNNLSINGTLSASNINLYGINKSLEECFNLLISNYIEK
jgi:hypothetical protein